MTTGMNISVVGVNHKTASVGIRENIFFKPEEISVFLTLITREFLDEAVIISTCNRTEIYGKLKHGNINAEVIIDKIIDYKNAGSVLTRKQFYLLFDDEAVRHLLEVSTSIDSLIVGDIQVLNQVRDAYKIAVDHGAVGALLHKVFQTAIKTGKRVKTETHISDGVVSVSYAAVEFTEKIFDDISTKNVLLIGAGETAELAAQHLRNRGIANLYIANRTFEKAELLCRKFNGAPLKMEEIQEKLPGIDIIISSISSDGYLLNTEQIKQTMTKRFSKPLLIIDIGIPRNVNPEVGKIENVFLEDIDSLNDIAKSNYEKRIFEMPKVHSIIDEEMKELYEWNHSRILAPTLEQIKVKLDEIRLEELEKHRIQLSEEEFQKINVITKSILTKIFVTPTINLRASLKNQSEIDNNKIIPFVKRIFGVN